MLSSLFREPQPDVRTHIRRGTGYAVTSILALLSGYLLSHRSVDAWELLLLLIPVSFSFSFFIVYALLFHYENPDKIINHAIYLNSQKNAFIFGAIFSILISVVATLVYRIATNAYPCVTLLVSSAIYGCLFNAYAIFLYKNRHAINERLVRHILVWPVVLSISFSLYFAQFFSCNNTSLEYILPVAIVVGYCLLSEVLKFNGKSLVVTGVLLYAVFLAAVSLGRFDLISQSTSACFSLMVFTIPLAAYLAVLESWRVTAYVSEVQEYRQAHALPVERDAYNFFFSTLAVLTISGILVPFVYVFSDFGTVFIAGYTVHSICIYIYWHKLSSRVAQLRQGRMEYAKFIAGFSFLLLMVVDSRLTIISEKVLLPKATDIGVTLIFAVALMSLGSVKRMLRSVPKNLEFIVRMRRLFRSVDIYPVCVICGSTIMSILMVIVRDFQSGNIVHAKISHAFAIYFLYVIIASVYMVTRHLLASQISALGIFVQGVISTTHMTTSVMAGALVFFSAINRGEVASIGILESIPFVFAAMGGFALNDYFDVGRDRINEPMRAIPSNAISRNDGLAIAVVLLAGSVILAWMRSSSRLELMLYISAIAGVLVYNIVIKMAAFLKNALTALICVTPAIYIMVVHELPISYLPFVVSLALFIMGREILMDIKDIKGDIYCKIRTVPAMIGVRRARIAAFSLVFFSVAIIMWPAVARISILNICLSLLLFVLAAANLRMWGDVSRERQRVVIASMRYQMMITGLYMLLW